MDKISRFMMTTCRGSGSMSFLSVSRPWSLPSVPEKMKRRKLQTVNMKSDWGVIFGYCLSLRQLLWNLTGNSFLDIEQVSVPASGWGRSSVSGGRASVWLASVNRRGTSFLQIKIHFFFSLYTAWATITILFKFI